MRPALAPRRWLPRRTVRLRLTLLYGALFLVSGIALLVLTNILVHRATGEPFLVARSADDGATAVGRTFRGGEPGNAQVNPDVVRILDAQAEEYRAAANAQRAADRRQLVIQSGIALSVMSVIALALGWIVAGRILQPLRTITAAARDISAKNLHERLDLKGPNDELKELGDTFDDLLGRLERAFDAQRQFVANASHELRTPLARQRTLIEVALTDPDASTASLRRVHERVLASGEEQEQLIESLLTLARAERGLDRHERGDLAAIVESVVDDAREDAERRGLSFEVDLAPAPIDGDRSLFERMVSNLLDNALRYNVAGGNVTVQTAVRDGLPLLVIANTGPVIAQGDVPALFQPFRRHGADRLHSGGHGLGLSIVSAVAAVHGATVEAVPRAEGGLEITVRF